MSRKLLIAEDFAAIRAAMEALETERRCPPPKTILEYLEALEVTRVNTARPHWVMTTGSAPWDLSLVKVTQGS